MEQAISAALALKGKRIPKTHPGKVEKYVNEFGESEVTRKLYSWLGKRSKAQYVDITREGVSVPHKAFNKKDAEQALKDVEVVIQKIKRILES